MTKDELTAATKRLMADLEMSEQTFVLDEVSVWGEGEHWIDLTDKRGKGSAQFRRITLGTYSAAAFEKALRDELVKVRDDEPPAN